MVVLNNKSIEYNVRYGLHLCKSNCALTCGNCPYYKFKDEINNDISKCTSALAKDAEQYINSLCGNYLNLPDTPVL